MVRLSFSTFASCCFTFGPSPNKPSKNRQHIPPNFSNKALNSKTKRQKTSLEASAFFSKSSSPSFWLGARTATSTIIWCLGKNFRFWPRVCQGGDTEAPSSFLFLVAMPGAPSSVLAPSSKARSPSSFLFLEALIKGLSRCQLLQTSYSPLLQSSLSASPSQGLGGGLTQWRASGFSVRRGFDSASLSSASFSLAFEEALGLSFKQDMGRSPKTTGLPCVEEAGVWTVFKVCLGAQHRGTRLPPNSPSSHWI